MEESEREITITENGKAETLSVFRAAVRRMHLEAVKGVASAAAKVLKMRQDTEQSTHALKVEYLVAILQCKVDWAEIVEECKRANRPLPKTLAPHPDDIVINQATMAIRFNGPEGDCQVNSISLRNPLPRLVDHAAAVAASHVRWELTG